MKLKRCKNKSKRNKKLAIVIKSLNQQHEKCRQTKTKS